MDSFPTQSSERTATAVTAGERTATAIHEYEKLPPEEINQITREIISLIDRPTGEFGYW